MARQFTEKLPPIAITPAHRELFAGAAALMGLNVATFVRLAAVEKARQQIREAYPPREK